MFSLLDNIRFIVVFVFLIFMIQSSTSSPLENDKLAQLIERFDRMQTKMDAMRSREEVLEAENAQLTERLDRMQAKMDAIQSREMQIQSRVEVLEAENDKWTRKFGELEAENEKLKRQISHPEFPLSPALKRDDGQSSKILTSPPTSCQELKNQNGLWPMDGIHLLKKNNKIQAAFCRFAADGSPVSEVLIGRVVVESKTVHFYVQRRSSFSTPNAVIPFDVALLNEGVAFDLPSGIFKVPVNGIYHFDLSALKPDSFWGLWIDFQVNGVTVGRAATYQGDSGTYDVVSLSASLRLAAGDKVNLLNAHPGFPGSLFEDNSHYTHFTGWLVEEELV